MSTLVEESLSVSGILLGKTMGRGAELADRFERRVAAARRPRGAAADGRPLGDGVDPDDVRGHAGARLLVRRLAIAHGGGAISIGTLVAFTTLQTRLFFPIGQLLSVGIDIQTSLALFDRVFEYLDLPVDLAERPGARELGAVQRRRRASRTSGSATRRTRRGRSRTSSVDGAGRARRRRSSARPAPARRRSATSSRGSTTSSAAASRSTAIDIRDVTLRVARAHRRRRLAGDVSLPRDRAREPALRAPGRDRRGGRGGGARGADPRPDRVAARGLRHHGRRARLPLLGRREAADRDRADGPAQPAGARPRRGDELARHADRARGAGRARPARGGPDDDRDRAPALDDPRRRPDRRPRPAAASSSAARTRSCSTGAAATPRSSRATREPVA